MHENHITSEGLIFLGAMNVTPWDLSSVGGPKDGWIVDSIALEINVTKQRDSLAVEPPRPLNRNGTVECTLNGRSGGDFTLANNLSSCYQHDARLHSSNTTNTTIISLFDNDNSAVVSHVDSTTAIFLALDTHLMTATLVQDFSDPNDTIYSVSEGNIVPTLKEFGQDGNVVLDLKWDEAERVQSYRDYKAEWAGNLSTEPDVFACQSGNGTEVYMSGNGATEHKVWTMWGGQANGTLSEVGSAGKSGVETTTVAAKKDRREDNPHTSPIVLEMTLGTRSRVLDHELCPAEHAAFKMPTP
ncbi:hypothetical protein ST47_g3361 [Ascochyta rabiei]|uniref:Uncharacterized protein n=1 Tax=Didymella rabiei TaxID=5454 RepID=A0A163HWL6_DIDRA|nr:hypothetical protein ST47_g3361 [Ascochyta rabiei]